MAALLMVLIPLGLLFGTAAWSIRKVPYVP